ncbi:MAG: ABC transporter substrate-binding protein [Gammaproteobacteria bacterium]
MRLIWLLAFILLIAIALAWMETEKTDEPKQTVSLAIATEPLDGLAMVSIDQDFFSVAGLDVQASLTASGKEALQALRDNKADFAFVAETPIVFDSLENHDLKILAQVGRNHDEPRIVALRNLGIQSMEDLRGRRIGTQKNSAVHFFMYLALLKHRLTLNDVEPVFMKANDLPEALASGKIDAFAMREPQVGQALQRLGDKAIVFAEPGLYVKTFSLVTTTSTLRAHPDVADRILRALLLAEDFVQRQPQAAQKLIAARSGIDEAKLSQLWPAFNFNVVLDQVLLLGLQEENRWLVETNITHSAEVPDYLDMIDTAALMRVKPNAVHIFH